MIGMVGLEFQTYHEDSVFGGPYTLFGIEFNSLFQLHNQTHTARLLNMIIVY